jgi:putative transposase
VRLRPPPDQGLKPLATNCCPSGAKSRGPFGAERGVGEVPATYTKLQYHVVFGTRHRQDLIVPEWEGRLYQYVGGVIREFGGVLTAMNGIENHVHLLAGFRAAESVSEMMKMIKGNSSRWVNQEKLTDGVFAWQKGYACFTVSESQVEAVRCYIRNQKEHHKTRTYEEEMEALLKRHGLELDKEHFGE